MAVLCVNIDHVATVREARRITEPDPIFAAVLVEKAGASGITVHLREDRRHIKDRDVILLRQIVKTKLNLEMAATDEMVKIALEVKPNSVCLVPEKREEITTEGGLDVVGQMDRIRSVTGQLQDNGIVVSHFINPIEEQIKASSQSGAKFIELHTGRYCEAYARSDEKKTHIELEALEHSAGLAQSLGLRVNAGHGLNYRNVRPVACISGVEDLNIGHSIIAYAIYVGLETAVRRMLKLIKTN